MDDLFGVQQDLSWFKMWVLNEQTCLTFTRTDSFSGNELGLKKKPILLANKSTRRGARSMASFNKKWEKKN